MSRRQHVVRSVDEGGVGSARSLGGCDIFCATAVCGDVYVGDYALIAPITITSSRTYRRCLVSATVGRVTASLDNGDPGELVVELYHEEADYVIASVRAPNDSPVCISGIADLPEGESTLCIRLYSADVGGWGRYDGAGLQVVAGQTVDEKGCIRRVPPPTFTLTFTGSGTASKNGNWEDAYALGYTSLTLLGVSLDMNFHPDDRAYVMMWWEDNSNGGYSTVWGEGIYTRNPPSNVPPRNEVRNLRGPVALDQTQFGPYGGLRDVDDPYYQSLSDLMMFPYLDLMSGPVITPVDQWSFFGVEVNTDRCWIPGHSCDDPAVAWSGSITFQFEGEGDDIEIEMV
jgi:hypothetical protein